MIFFKTQRLSSVKTFFTFCCTLCILSSAHGQLTKRAVHIGLNYPASTNGAAAYKYSNALSLHALVGVSGEERAFIGSGIASVVKGNACGFQGAGLLNAFYGNSSGFTGAGLVNVASHTQGFVGAGLLNTYQSGSGFAGAGLMNIAADSVNGVQMAGLINTGKSMKGLQGAGLINRATNVHGVQMAGLFNVARTVKGVQFAGLINIADTSDYSIAVINIIKNGERTLGTSIDDNESTFLSFRSGGRKLYGIIGVGINLHHERRFPAWQGGFGMHILAHKQFRLNSELIATKLESLKDSGEFFKSSIAILPELRFGKVIVFGGPTVNFVMTDSWEGEKLVSHAQWNRRSSHSWNAMYIGYTGGLQLVLR